MDVGNGAKRDGFSSKFGVIAATAGSAVGLGNIWRFPYVAGENGGGAFLLIYIFFILLIGVPAMLSEFLIGRNAQSNAFGTFRKLAPNSLWLIVGFMGILASFLILAFYSSVAGWTLEYLYQAIGNGFTNGDTNVMFDTFLQGTLRPLMWQTLFMILTALIVFTGVKDGIEKYTKLLMPLLFVLIIGMCVRSISLPGSIEGIKFLFKPDFSKINVNVILEALGQATFSLSVGAGVLITYGSYISKDNNLGNTVVKVAFTDTLIAILSGVMIFPAVFALGFDPNSGPGLVFVVLPKLFLEMPAGYIFSIIFFFLLVVAALTSTVSMLEVFVAFLSEELKITRKKATITGSITIFIFGIFATLSFSNLSNFKLFDKTMFGIMEYIAANVLLPLVSLFIAIFVGWKLKKHAVKEEFSNQNTLKAKYFNVFYVVIRYIVPAGILVIFIKGLFFSN